LSVADILHRRYLDEFDKYAASSDGSPNWEVTGGTWLVTGNLYQASTSAVGHISVKADLLLRDLRAEFVVNWTTTVNWDVGFFFRGEAADEENDCYFVTLAAGGLYLKKYLAGTPSTLGSYAFSPSSSTNYTIKIWCEGEERVVIKVELDGTQRISVVDSTNPHEEEGTLGFLSQSAGSEVVTFDTVDIWGIEDYVHKSFVRAAIGDRIKRFNAVVDNSEGIRATRYAFNDDIEIWRNNTRLFAGMLENVIKTSAKGSLIKLEGRDYTAYLLYVYAIKAYSNQEISTTFKDLLTTYAPQFGQTNIDNTGISLAPEYKNRQLFSIGREYGEMAEFELWSDAEKEMYFKPRNYADSGVTFSEADNILDYDMPSEGERIYTKVTVYGKQGVAVQVENRSLREELGFEREAPPITDPAIATNAEGKKRGEAFLAKRAIPKIIKIHTWGQETLNVGSLATVNITDELILNYQYVVLQIDYITPGLPSTIVTLARYAEGIEDIILSLRSDANTLLASEQDLEATLERWLTLTKEDLVLTETKITISKRTASDAFILGHDTFGVLGAGGYGLGDRSGEWIILEETEDP